MEFRWIAGIAMWTILVGPVFYGQGSVSPKKSRGPRAPAAVQPSAPARPVVSTPHQPHKIRHHAAAVPDHRGNP
jgi:hypothetical protein